MATHEIAAAYEPPALTYHGQVRELTSSQHLVAAGQAVRFAASFAASVGPTPDAATSAHAAVQDPSKSLPFTGFAAIGVAGVGAALATSGAMLKRFTRRRSAADQAD